MEVTVQPAERFHGNTTCPGDKSISHRALMIAAISEGTSVIRGLLEGLDVQSTAACLRAMGVEIASDPYATRVTGVGLHSLRAPESVLDAGNSGTTMRLLSGILAGQSFATKITGDDSLRSRPMNRVIKPLEQMGAKISAAGDGFAPLEIRGGVLQPLSLIHI